MKKRTLIVLGLAVSMMASTATAFAGEGGYVINENGQRVWVDDLDTYNPTTQTETGHYEVNEDGQQVWVEGITTESTTDSTKGTTSSSNAGTGKVAGAVDGTYTKSPVKGYAVQNENNCMVNVSEDPGVTGSHNGKTYCIIYEDGAKEFVRADKTTFIQSAPKVETPTENTGNSGNKEDTSSGVTIGNGIAVKSCPSQAEIKAYVKTHPFTDNKINWDAATYSVKPDPEHGVIGKLSSRSEQQYINYCNFARYCVGLPELKLNSNLSNKAMHAAALSYLAYINGHYEAHYPTTRPAGLTDEQWSFGKTACAESSIIANNNYYKSTPAICQAFLIDEYNKIGHRITNFKETEEMGIGLVNGTGSESTAWITGNNKSSIVNEQYIAYPGTNFPVELMQRGGGQIKECASGMYNFIWSVSLGSDYKVSNPSNLKVVFDHSRYGKKVLNATTGTDSKNAVAYYTQKKLDGPGTVYFTPIYDGDEDDKYRWKSFDIGDKCTVTLTGIEKNGQPATIKYTTTLFSVFGYNPIYKGNTGGNTNVPDPDEDDDNEYVEPERPSISKPNPAPSVTVKKDATGDKVTTGSGTTSKTYSLTSVSKKYAKLVKTGSATTLTVPDTIKSKKTGKSYKVTAITARVKKNAKLTSLTIGNNVTTIGTAAFYGNKSLKKIVVKGNLTSVGSKAFKGVPKTAKVYVYSTSKTKYNAVVKKLKAAGLTKNSFTYKAK